MFATRWASNSVLKTVSVETKPILYMSSGPSGMGSQLICKAAPAMLGACTMALIFLQQEWVTEPCHSPLNTVSEPGLRFLQKEAAADLIECVADLLRRAGDKRSLI